MYPDPALPLRSYGYFDLLVQLDERAGRWLRAARTYERKGDPASLDRAAQLYAQQAQRPDLAAALLLRRAVGPLLWSGSGADWPPPAAKGKGMAHLAAALAALRGSGGEATGEATGEGSGSQAGADDDTAHGALRLAAEALEFVARCAVAVGGAKGYMPSSASQLPGGEWERWRERVAAAEKLRCPGGSFARLLLLRWLVQRATEALRAALTSPRVAARGGPAQPAAAANEPDVATVGAAADALLRTWGLYRRCLANALSVLKTAAQGGLVACGRGRDAALLLALLAYHGVFAARDEDEHEDEATEGEGAKGGGGGQRAHDVAAEVAALAGAELRLGCDAAAAWVAVARKQTELRLRPVAAAAGAVSAEGGGGSGATQYALGATDFASAAALYWRAELRSRSKLVLGCLTDAAAALAPSYEAFRRLGGAGQALIISDPMAKDAAVDATLLRAELVAAAATEARAQAQQVRPDRKKRKKKKRKKDLRPLPGVC